MPVCGRSNQPCPHNRYALVSRGLLVDCIKKNDATNYYGEQDCADAFDDAGLSARYFDKE